VTNETLGGLSGSEVPKTEGLVPGGRKSEIVVIGESNVTNEVRVTGKTLKWVAVLGISFNFLSSVFLVSSKLPDHEGSVSGTSDKEV